MIYNGVYEIDLRLGQGNTAIAFDPSEITFTIKDSIWKLYPTMHWMLKDNFGTLQEMLLPTEGMEVNVSYGYAGTFMTCPFVLRSPSLPQTIRNGYIGGDLDITLTHDYSNKQTLQSKNWQGTPLESYETVFEVYKKYKDQNGFKSKRCRFWRHAF